MQNEVWQAATDIKTKLGKFSEVNSINLLLDMNTTFSSGQMIDIRGVMLHFPFPEKQYWWVGWEDKTERHSTIFHKKTSLPNPKVSIQFQKRTFQWYTEISYHERIESSYLCPSVVFVCTPVCRGRAQKDQCIESFMRHRIAYHYTSNVCGLSIYMARIRKTKANVVSIP